MVVFLQDVIDHAVQQLLALKADYKNLTGIDFSSGGRANASAKKDSKQPKPVAQKKQPGKEKEKTIHVSGIMHLIYCFFQ